MISFLILNFLVLVSWLLFLVSGFEFKICSSLSPVLDFSSSLYLDGRVSKCSSRPMEKDIVPTHWWLRVAGFKGPYQTATSPPSLLPSRLRLSVVTMRYNAGNCGLVVIWAYTVVGFT